AICVLAALSCIKREWRNVGDPAQGSAAAAEPTTGAVQTPAMATPEQATGNYGKVQGVDVLAGKGVRAFAIQGKVERIDAKWFPAEGQPFAEYIQVQAKDNVSGAVQPWDVQLRASNEMAVEAGDVMLATLYFRTRWIGDEYGEGQSEF